MEIAVHHVPRPSAPDAPTHPLVVALAEIDRLLHLVERGHTDYAEPAVAWAVELLPTPTWNADAWIALPAGADPAQCAPEDALGYATVARSLVDDLDLVEVFVGVRPEVRRHGVGRALYDAASALIDEIGRPVRISWSFSPALDAADPRAVVARSGNGAVDGTAPAAQWLLREGYVLEQVGRRSLLEIPQDADADAWRRTLARARAEAAGRAGDDYAVETWTDATPEDRLDALAALRRRMSADVPTAGLAYGEQSWDAQRIRHHDAREAAGGRRQLTTVVRHRPSGELVAYTQLIWPAATPAGVWQADTLVEPAHRGHRLGMLIKAANLQALLDVDPAAARVHTENADENEHMLAINDLFGFQVVGVDGFWQRRG